MAVKLMFLLSGKNVELAKEEVIALTKAKHHKHQGRVLVLESGFRDFNRLAYTKKVCRLLFECRTAELEEAISKVDWNRYYKKSFCVRALNPAIPERKLASMIWGRLKRPCVKLKDPGTQIEFVFGRTVFCGILLKEVEKDYLKRRPHFKPGFHPTSMDPQLARALVNLTGVKRGETFLDPFMGVGGIIVEAGMLGAKLIGNDISKKMLSRAEANLKHYRLRARIFNKDATMLSGLKVDAIATDPPYGVSSYTSEKDTRKLYSMFLRNAYSLLKPGRRMVIVFPREIRIGTKLVKLGKIMYPVHPGLTRRIVIYQKR